MKAYKMKCGKVIQIDEDDAITDTGTAEVKKENTEFPNWLDLPVNVLESILYQLNLEDNVRASVVCKLWNSVATSVLPLHQTPWLMTFPKLDDDCYELYDPEGRTITYSLELPELRDSRACYSKEGWLLIQHGAFGVVFFNPFTRKLIHLPGHSIIYNKVVGFTCAPTSPNCVVFAIENLCSPTNVTICTCYPGAPRWITVSYDNNFPLPSEGPHGNEGNMWKTFVVCNGLFYCMTLSGWLGVFDPSHYTWIVLEVHPPKLPQVVFSDTRRRTFMIEKDGDLLVFYTCSHSGLNPLIYKLNRTIMEWEEMTTLDGGTLFVDFVSSCYFRTSLPRRMGNRVYFPKVSIYDHHCISSF